MSCVIIGDNNFGLSESMLLSYVESGDMCSKHLPQLPAVTNELILELVKFKNKHSECTYKTFHRWLIDIYGERWPQPDSPTYQAITRSVERLNARLTKIKKQHSCGEKEEVLSSFMQEEFILPKLGFHKGKVVNYSPTTSKSASSHDKINIQQIKEAREKAYAIKRNANKRLKRKEAIIQTQKDRILASKRL